MKDIINPAGVFWQSDEPLECVSVIPELANTATFTFRAPSGALFDFRPGQFLTLELPVPGAPCTAPIRFHRRPRGHGPFRSRSRRRPTASAPAGCWTTLCPAPS